MINPDERDLCDFGIIKTGVWLGDGEPFDWHLESSHIAEDLPRQLLSQPVLQMAPGPLCSVYVRGYYSDVLTKNRRKTVVTERGVAGLKTVIARVSKELD